MNLIVNAVIELVDTIVAVLASFLLVLPDAQLPLGMQQAMSNMGGVLYPLSYIIPFDTLAQCLFWYVVVSGGVVVYKFVRFGLSLIPFL